MFDVLPDLGVEDLRVQNEEGVGEMLELGNGCVCCSVKYVISEVSCL